MRTTQRDGYKHTWRNHSPTVAEIVAAAQRHFAGVPFEELQITQEELADNSYITLGRRR